MRLLTQSQIDQLIANGRVNAAHIAVDGKTEDFQPVVKLFCPWTDAVWLISELDPEDPDLAFGLCDLGLGFAELGNVRLSELESVTGPGGLKVECDPHFTANATVTEYAAEAQRIGAVIA
jgi:hypothetical protein